MPKALAILRFQRRNNPSLQLYDRYVRDSSYCSRGQRATRRCRAVGRQEELSRPQMRQDEQRQWQPLGAQLNAVDGGKLAHAGGGEVGIGQQPGLIGEAEDVGVVDDAPRRFHAADHAEMILEAVQPGQEDDAGLVELRRRLEDLARQRRPSGRGSRG